MGWKDKAKAAGSKVKETAKKAAGKAKEVAGKAHKAVKAKVDEHKAKKAAAKPKEAPPAPAEAPKKSPKGPKGKPSKARLEQLARDSTAQTLKVTRDWDHWGSPEKVNGDEVSMIRGWDVVAVEDKKGKWWVYHLPSGEKLPAKDGADADEKMEELDNKYWEYPSPLEKARHEERTGNPSGGRGGPGAPLPEQLAQLQRTLSELKAGKKVDLKEPIHSAVHAANRPVPESFERWTRIRAKLDLVISELGVCYCRPEVARVQIGYLQEQEEVLTRELKAALEGAAASGGRRSPAAESEALSAQVVEVRLEALDVRLIPLWRELRPDIQNPTSSERLGVFLQYALDNPEQAVSALRSGGAMWAEELTRKVAQQQRAGLDRGPSTRPAPASTRSTSSAATSAAKKKPAQKPKKPAEASPKPPAKKKPPAPKKPAKTTKKGGK